MVSKKIKASVASLVVALSMGVTSIAGISANALTTSGYSRSISQGKSNSVSTTTSGRTSSNTQHGFLGTTSLTFTKTGNGKMSVKGNLGQGNATYSGEFMTSQTGSQQYTLYMTAKKTDFTQINGKKCARNTYMSIAYTMSLGEYISFCRYGTLSVTNVAYHGEYAISYNGTKITQDSYADFTAKNLKGKWVSDAKNYQ